MKKLINKKFLIAVMLIAFLAVPFASSVIASEVSDYGLDQAQDLTLGQTSADEVVIQVINVALGLLGLIAVILILIGGFMWMTAGGNTDKVDKARKFIINGVVGLIIVLAAYGIASFVIDKIVGATNV